METEVRIVITDLLARTVRELTVHLQAGENQLRVKTDGVGKGMHLVSPQTSLNKETAKLIVERRNNMGMHHFLNL